ncbi:MAG: Gfo/Idh/MocA family oxidoreductase [Phycisphaeraceae bacterium]
MIKLAVLGCGQRAAYIASRALQADPEVQLAMVADPDRQRAEKNLAEWRVELGPETAFVPGIDRLLDAAGDLDGVIVGTRCDLHADLAVRLAPTGLPVFLEKPIATTLDDLTAIARAYRDRSESVVVSFPLRMSPLFRRAWTIVRSGRLGTINQVQAVNYVPYGGVYFGQWYRDDSITGGMWLQKATHDFDYITRLSGLDPVKIAATESQLVYGGDKPEGLMCSACDEAASCPESPQNIKARDDDGGMGKGDHACAFSSSIVNHDAGSAMIQYAGGLHANYVQNFVSRRSAQARGARVTGYLGTLEFDWYTSTIRVIEHHGKAVEEIKLEDGDDHHGGDALLVRNFIDVIRDEGPSASPLEAGLLSAAMCLAARDSAQKQTFESIPRPLKTVPVRGAPTNGNGVHA